MRFRGVVFGFSLVILGVACDQSQPSHVPRNPLVLPILVAGSALDNAVYSTRRRFVERFVAENHGELIMEIRAGGGPALMHAFKLARIPVDRTPHVEATLQEDAALYANDLDALVVALMVHGR